MVIPHRPLNFNTTFVWVQGGTVEILYGGNSISIQLLCGFKLYLHIVDMAYCDFNTTFVWVQGALNKEVQKQGLLFQYNFCVGSSFKFRQERAVIQEFQYNFCVGSS